MCIINLLSGAIPDAISSSDTSPVTISRYWEAISEAISNSHPKTISETNTDHSHPCIPVQDGGLRQWLWEAVSKHVSCLSQLKSISPSLAISAAR